MGEVESVDSLLRDVALRAQRGMDLPAGSIFLTDENNPGTLRLRAAAGSPNTSAPCWMGAQSPSPPTRS